MSETTPRVTAPFLEQFSHRTVRIVGKLRQIRGEQATIDAGGNITIHQNRVSISNRAVESIPTDAVLQDAHLQLNHAVEIIGKVQNDLSVKVMASTDLGPEGGVDWDAIDAVVDATHRYHEIFYDKEQ